MNHAVNKTKNESKIEEEYQKENETKRKEKVTFVSDDKLEKNEIKTLPKPSFDFYREYLQKTFEKPRNKLESLKSDLKSTTKENLIKNQRCQHFTIEGLDLLRNKVDGLETDWNTEETFKNNSEKDIDKLKTILKRVLSLRLESL